MKKGYGQLLSVFAIAILFAFLLNSISASALASAPNERYAIQINNLGCEITDYEIHVDLWHLRVAGSYTATLNNSADTDVSIRWNEGNGDSVQKRNGIIIPARTVKKYDINFSFHLLSRDFSYEYKMIF